MLGDDQLHLLEVAYRHYGTATGFDFVALGLRTGYTERQSRRMLGELVRHACLWQMTTGSDGASVSPEGEHEVLKEQRRRRREQQAVVRRAPAPSGTASVPPRPQPARTPPRNPTVAAPTRTYCPTCGAPRSPKRGAVSVGWFGRVLRAVGLSVRRG